jgi:hypothetical protein
MVLITNYHVTVKNPVSYVKKTITTKKLPIILEKTYGEISLECLVLEKQGWSVMDPHANNVLSPYRAHFH